MTDFIGVYDLEQDNNFCSRVMEYVNKIKMISRIDNQETSTLNISGDEYFFITEDDKTLINFNNQITTELLNLIIGPFEDYKKRYDTAFSSINKFVLNPDIKLQKTGPAQGYHVWHAEAADMLHSRRVVFFIMYLNDIKEGGETEFLYQNKRITAKAGRLIFSPTYWTHMHRGNPPLHGDKYILTGWFELIE